MKLVDFSKLLPADLQPGERVLWHGRPDWLGMARRAFRGDVVSAYFAAMAIWNFASAYADAGLAEGSLSAVKTIASGAVALALLGALAYASSRTSLYVVTTQRVVAKVGIALPVFFNFPYAQVASASVHRHGDGTADIPLTLAGDARVAYLQLWPHARPFHYRYPQPMLRAAPDGMAVAETLARAMIAAANARGEAAQAPDRAAKPAYAYDAAAPAFG